MFSPSVDYALRAVCCLAMNPGKNLTTEQISSITRVPAPYLAKLIKLLNNAEILNSHRGVNGGSMLARPASEISVLEVVNAIEPLQRIKTCPLGIKEHGVNLCRMHQQLNEATASMEGVLAGSSIQDLLNNPTQSIPMTREKT